MAPNPNSTRPGLSRRFSVAPMMDWTDHHCRYFMRLLSSQALLYTEMVTTGALLHGDRERFLRHDETEHPLALQLGGSTAADLAACARLAEEAGYDEVNLNVGCPSDRVQNNMIGACLMAHPQLVADCVKAMRDAVGIPVTVKHRIGINGRDSYAELCDFVGTVHEAGCQSFTVHARIAILEGLSPKENRDIPPLRYDVVAQLKTDFPELEIVLNGGIKTLEQCSEHLQTFDGVMLGREAYHNPYLLAQVDQQLFGSEHLQTFDGVMLGREAYHNPYLLAQVDQQLFGSVAPVISRHEALESMRPYIAAHIASGGNMHHVTRHMLGLGLGFPGARRFRQLLSVDIHKAENPLLLLDQAAKFLEGH
ncbi:tRNA dihydrouridine(20/20a) synthase DusA [Pseudomonas syringae]|uniref:tRNA dihydrouridine(20/20a) synthase DusA n=1 Tax=Pseudomonas syringae TaxID=317 RepID=UPI00358DB411